MQYCINVLIIQVISTNILEKEINKLAQNMATTNFNTHLLCLI